MLLSTKPDSGNLQEVLTLRADGIQVRQWGLRGLGCVDRFRVVSSGWLPGTGDLELNSLDDLVCFGFSTLFEVCVFGSVP